MKKFLLALCALFSMRSFSDDDKRGIVCFSFDDYHGKNWLRADALFKKYDARATFLVVGEITRQKAAVMKELRRRGHTVGLHSMRHRDAPGFIAEYGEVSYFEKEVKPQLDACRKFGVKVHSFAYPNNRRDERCDKLMFKYFDYLRAGYGADKKTIYYSRAGIGKKMVLGGGGIGVFYKTDVNELKKRLDEAAKNDAVIVFFSHNIAPGAGHVHMPTETLEELLKYARSLNMHIAGFEELPALKRKED